MKKIILIFAFLCSFYSVNFAESSDMPLSKLQEPLPLAQKIINTMRESINSAGLLDDDNLDLNFIAFLISSNQGIIESSQLILKHNQYKSNAINSVAKQALDSQYDEISYSYNLLEKLKAQGNIYSPKEVALYQKEARFNLANMSEVFATTQWSNNANEVYLLALLLQHQDMINTANNLLQYTQNADVKQLALDIITKRDEKIQAISKMLWK